MRDTMFGKPEALIARAHLGPPPGSPRFPGNLKAVIGTAVEDARAFEAGGMDAIRWRAMRTSLAPPAPRIRPGWPPWPRPSGPCARQSDSPTASLASRTTPTRRWRWPR